MVIRVVVDSRATAFGPLVSHRRKNIDPQLAIYGHFEGSGMLPDSLMAKASNFVSNSPAVHELHAWMMSKPMLAQAWEWMGLLNQHRWGFIVILMVLGMVLRFISPFITIFRLLWTTAIRLLMAIIVHFIVIPLNRLSAWLGRPRPQRYVRPNPPASPTPPQHGPGPNDQMR